MRAGDVARVCFVLAGVGLSTTACDVDPITGYDVSIVTQQDCVQIGINAPQCIDEEEAAARRRDGRWIIEDKSGANIINPFSSFVLTNDQGRIITGVHFLNDASLTTTNACAGEGGECYFARIRVDALDEETGCQAIHERSFDFDVIDGKLEGVGSEVRLIGFEEVCTEDEAGAVTCELVPLDACGTTTISQLLVAFTGVQVDEPVMAREDSF